MSESSLCLTKKIQSAQSTETNQECRVDRSNGQICTCGFKPHYW